MGENIISLPLFGLVAYGLSAVRLAGKKAQNVPNHPIQFRFIVWLSELVPSDNS